MNSVLEKALREEGLDDNAIQRVEKVLWDRELIVSWDRDRHIARYRAQKEAERKAEAEKNAAAAKPYTGTIDCQVSVHSLDGHWSWTHRCERKAKWVVDGKDGKPLAVCTQHMKTGNRDRDRHSALR